MYAARDECHDGGVSVLLRIAYDGTDFHGYARQEGVRTVQGELEAALGRTYKQAVRTRGASRTDAGVHARGQIAAFEDPLNIPLDGLVRALIGELPPDLVATAAWRAELPDGRPVEPRYHNLGKHYRYGIRRAQLRDPMSSRYEWLVPRRLDVAAMQRAARAFVGEHDFSAFRASDCQAKGARRRVVEVTVAERGLTPVPDDRVLVGEPGKANAEKPTQVDIDVHGEAFLKNMVRIMVGTLVDVGLGRFPTDRIDALLKEGDRPAAGPTAPAAGLTLVEVKWPADWPSGSRAFRGEAGSA
jgi:tRNA pseudouridine38-40 synthase